MKNWRQYLLITLDVAIAVYVVLAMTAFNKPDNADGSCTEVRIAIRQDAIGGFLTQKDIQKMLIDNGIYPLGKPMSSVSLRQIEEFLQQNKLIGQAEVFSTPDNRVNITVVQRIPVVRILSGDGADYYVDSQGVPMPRSPYTSDVIVATGHITQDYARTRLAPLACQLLEDDFWNSQIEQLNVLADGSLEMVPRVGGHIVYLGQPVRIAKKLERLAKFYRFGLSRVGWNRYSRISVEFDNQIICKKK